MGRRMSTHKNKRSLVHRGTAGVAFAGVSLVLLSTFSTSFLPPLGRFQRVFTRPVARSSQPQAYIPKDVPGHHRKRQLSMGIQTTAAELLQHRLAAFTEAFTAPTGSNVPWEPSQAVLNALDAAQAASLQELAANNGLGIAVQHILDALGDAAVRAGMAVNGIKVGGDGANIEQFLHSCLGPPLKTAAAALTTLGLNEEQVSVAMAAAAVLGGAAVVRVAFPDRSPIGEGADWADLPTTYDLEKLGAFYRKKPLIVATRFLEVSATLSWFAIELIRDIVTEKWDENCALRGRQLRELTSKNGPAFIKVGQGASVRPDILPGAWIKEMEQLQDNVAAFGAAEARLTMENSLGCKLEDVFEDVSVFSKPVAAASLGQVYKAKLKSTGEEVAVKVQRPAVLYTVTRDLYVMRLILQLLTAIDRVGPVRVRDAATATRNLIDSWAVRFMEELDYLQEASNQDRFRTEMSKSDALGSAVIVPAVYHALTNRYVLVTEWVEGVKVSSLDVNTVDGRARLATLQATLLNAYLTQLLESGYLHADPHPGNFLLTPEGKLVILDFGLMTEVNESQRYALVEYVIHLIAKDYDATLFDLITLEFIDPRIGTDPEKAKMVVPLLAKVMEQLSEGGGAKTITIESVGEEVEQLARNYPIGIPSYFGLIIRAFGALEGLGLSMDPHYSIVKECFPYLARRLLTEDSPRMRSMLKSFLYGKDGKVLRVDQVDEIIEGYTAFTALAAEASASTTPFQALTDKDSATTRPYKRGSSLRDARDTHSGSVNSQGPGGFFFRRGPVSRIRGLFSPIKNATGSKVSQVVFDPMSDPVAQDALKLLFAKEGNYVQDIVVEELARMTDALGREVNLEMVKILRRVGDTAMSPLPLLNFKPNTSMNPLLIPIQLPYVIIDKLIQRVETMLELSDEDRESLTALRRLMSIMFNASRRAKQSRGYHNPYAGLFSSAQTDTSLALIAPADVTGPLALTVDEERSLFTNFSLSSVGPKAILEAARRLAPVVPLIAPGAPSFGDKFVRRLAGRALMRIASGVMPKGIDDWERLDQANAARAQLPATR